MQTIPQVIKAELESSVPDALRSAVTAIFLKPGARRSKLQKWQTYLISNPEVGERKARYIKPKYKPAIYNAMVLCYLMSNTGKVRNLFNNLLEGKKKPIEEAINIIEERFQQQFSEFFCLGIVQESLEPIIQKIQDETWKPLTERLPCPFSSGNLKSLAPLYGKNIPWSEYHSTYSKALKEYQNNRLDIASELLQTLESEAVIRLPIVTTLLKQIQLKIDTSQQYFEYLQENL